MDQSERTAVETKPPTRMTQDEYLRDRLDDQISWYDGKSGSNKKRFITIRIVEVVIAALIPVASTFAKAHPEITVPIIAVLGGAVAACSAILALFQLQENWIEYRTTAESLKKEKYLFLTGGEPYDDDDAFGILVQRVETLVSKENTNWAQYMMKPRTEHPHG